MNKCEGQVEVPPDCEQGVTAYAESGSRDNPSLRTKPEEANEPVGS